MITKENSNWFNKKANLIILLISFVSISILSILFTHYMVNQYSISKPNGWTYTFYFWLIHLTHLNMIFMSIWTILLMKSPNNKNINLDLNNIFLAISLLVGILYFPSWMSHVFNGFDVIFTNAIPDDWNNESINFSPEIYCFIDIVQTTLAHIYIPIIAIFLYISTREKKIDMLTPIINTTFISIYYIIAIMSVSIFDVQDPYGFFDYSSSIDNIIINILAASIALGVFLLIPFVQYKIIKFNSNKK